MLELVHADIFFFISSVAVILLTIATLVVLYYLVALLKRLQNIADKTQNFINQLNQIKLWLKEKWWE